MSNPKFSIDYIVEVGKIIFIYRNNSTKKDKENKAKQNKGKLCTANNYIH